jgi:hypothetical protein
MLHSLDGTEEFNENSVWYFLQLWHHASVAIITPELWH